MAVYVESKKNRHSERGVPVLGREHQAAKRRVLRELGKMMARRTSGPVELRLRRDRVSFRNQFDPPVSDSEGTIGRLLDEREPWRGVDRAQVSEILWTAQGCPTLLS